MMRLKRGTHVRHALKDLGVGAVQMQDIFGVAVWWPEPGCMTLREAESDLCPVDEALDLSGAQEIAGLVA